MAEKNEWTSAAFGRRQYTIEGGGTLDNAKRIRIRIDVDGTQILDMQIREPGILAVISRPAEEGIDIELVEPGGVRFVDVELPNGERRSPSLLPWQLEQLGLKK